MEPAPIKPVVSVEDLDRLDIRAGTILSVEAVAASDKLMKLTVDFGDHTRSILAGIKKERADPTELVGRQALFIVNLPPREMAGEVSEGMLFDVGYQDEIVPVLAVTASAIPNGTRAG